MKQTKEIRAIAEWWTNTECYLDGKPAVIKGRLNQFATVATRDGTAAVEFSWQAVNRVMYGKMEFCS